MGLLFISAPLAEYVRVLVCRLYRENLQVEVGDRAGQGWMPDAWMPATKTLFLDSGHPRRRTWGAPAAAKLNNSQLLQNWWNCPSPAARHSSGESGLGAAPAGATATSAGAKLDKN